MFRNRVLPFLIWLVYSAWSATWRLRVHESPELKSANARPIVFAHWHGDELALLTLLTRYRGAVMTSTSKDGELITSVLRLMKIPAARGSSTRGGSSALKGILRLARDGFRPTVAVDGPKGPYHKAKPGVFEISRIIDGDIHPAGCSCTRAIVFRKAWNKTFLPLPFATIHVVFGPPIPAVGRGEDPRDPALALRLETALANAGQQARNLIAAPHRRC